MSKSTVQPLRVIGSLDGLVETSTVARVALALHDALDNPEDAEAKAGCLELARAAILAMREPSPAMVEAGTITLTNKAPWKIDPTRFWQRMIDAALKEPAGE